MSRRDKELALIHIGKKELGWDDDTYRETLRAWTGKRSSGKMTQKERATVIDGMKRLGFTPSGDDAPQPVTVDDDDSPQVKKIKMLWRELHRHGAVKNPSLPSLNAFSRRMTNNEHVRFCTPDEASDVIEALKGWLRRVQRTNRNEATE